MGSDRVADFARRVEKLGREREALEGFYTDITARMNAIKKERIRETEETGERPSVPGEIAQLLRLFANAIEMEREQSAELFKLLYECLELAASE